MFLVPAHVFRLLLLPRHANAVVRASEDIFGSEVKLKKDKRDKKDKKDKKEKKEKHHKDKKEKSKDRKEHKKEKKDKKRKREAELDDDMFD